MNLCQESADLTGIEFERGATERAGKIRSKHLLAQRSKKTLC
jgi:hypothetical protein